MLVESGAHATHLGPENSNAPTWQSLIEHSPAATIVADPGGRVRVWNAAAARLLGVPAAAALGHPLPGLLAGDPPAVPPWFGRALAGDTVAAVAWPPAPARTLTATAGPVHASGGAVTGVMLVLQPAAPPGRGDADALQRITDAMPGVVFQFRLHPDGTFTLPYASRGALDVWGLSPEEAVRDLGKVWALVDPADFPGLQASIARSARDLTPWCCEIRIRTPQGQAKWMRGTSQPRREPDGGVLWHGIVLDVTDRKRAEDALRQSEARLTEAQRLAAIGSWEWAVGTESVWWSDEMYRIFGQEPGAVAPTLQGFLHSLPAEERDAVAARIDAALTRNEPYDFDHGVVLPDGTAKTLHTLGHVETDAAGLPARLVGTCQDVTERRRAEADRRRAEQALRVSELRFRIGFEHSPVGMAMAVPAADAAAAPGPMVPGRMVKVNAALCQFLGSTPADILNHPDPMALILERTHPDDRAKDLELFQRVWTGGLDTYRLEKRFVLPDGGLRWGELSVGVVRAADGRIEYAISQIIDITDRKLMEQMLREREEQLRLALEAAHQGTWDWNLVTSTVTVSEQVEVMFGLSPGTLTYTLDTLWPLLHPDDVATMRRHVAEAQGGDPAHKAEFRVLDRDGGCRWLESRGSVRRDDTGRPVRLLGTVMDVTERKLMELQLQQTQKLESLGLLAGGIAHDFNNLLTVILGNAGLALLDLGPGSAAAGLVREVEKAASRAADLTQQMLAYSGKGTFQVQPVELSELVREMAQLLHAALPRKAHLVFEFAPDLPLIEADATQVRQIVMNLITNAAEALQEQSGVVVLATGVLTVEQPALYAAHAGAELAPGPYVYLRVNDTGCGMDAATQARIFDPFFTTKFTGRGLGLAAVLGIIRGHRGAIKVTSALGRGTTFEVLFPYRPLRATGPGAAAAAAPAASEWRGYGTLLIVDDEASVRALVQYVLEQAGFAVLTAADGQAGVDLFERVGRDVDAVLLDLTMPRLSGLEALRELRRLRPGVPVVLMSGYSEQDIRTRCAGQEPTAFLQKPFFAEHLLAAVQRALEG
jgi:PAS domain S-box-containing protein